MLNKLLYYPDIKQVITNNTNTGKYGVKVILHTEKLDLSGMIVHTLDEVKDYVNQAATKWMIDISFPMGTYVYDIYPYRHNLELTLFKTKVYESGAKPKNTKELWQKFKVIFRPENLNVEGTQYHAFDKATLNIRDFTTIKLELLDLGFELLRTKLVSGNYLNTNRETLIKTLIGVESSVIKVNGKPIVDAVNVVPSHNKDLIKQVTIPSNTKLISIVDYIQNKAGGLYKEGAGLFYQWYNDKRTVFCYPIYTDTQVSNSDKQLMLYALPSDMSSGIEKTYKDQNNVLVVLVTGQQNMSDNQQHLTNNDGVGVRVTDPRSLMNKPVLIFPDIKKPLKITRPANQTEVSFYERDDKVNTSKDYGVSSNPYPAYSQTVAGKMQRLDVVWENSDSQLLYPGMIVTYHFQKGKVIHKLKGTLVAVHAVGSLVTKGAASKVLGEKTFLTMVVK